ncbi:mitochondrial carrier domain-containing protein, partial [Protomyces lactucae-debilis]
AFAGLCAGAVSTTAMHPLDMVKTRMQVGDGTTLSLLKQIHQGYGLRGLYRGLGTNLVGGMLGWSFYFAWYGQIKHLFGSARRRLDAHEYLASSGTAGLLTALCTNPIWVIKTRMLTTNRDDAMAYRNAIYGLRKILKAEGIRGLYRGVVPSMFGVSHAALQFTAYEKLKDWRMRTWSEQPMNTWDFLEVSAASKAVAVVVTYPYQVLRSRLQMHDAPVEATMVSTFRDIRRKSGLLGFYRGLAPNFLRVVPATCITMLCYEQV